VENEKLFLKSTHRPLTPGEATSLLIMWKSGMLNLDKGERRDSCKQITSDELARNCKSGKEDRAPLQFQ